MLWSGHKLSLGPNCPQLASALRADEIQHRTRIPAEEHLPSMGHAPEDTRYRMLETGQRHIQHSLGFHVQHDTKWRMQELKDDINLQSCGIYKARSATSVFIHTRFKQYKAEATRFV